VRPDEALMVKALQQGDETAFRSFVEAWQDMVFNTILGIVQNEEDAEDVAQDSFIQAYESIGHFKGESKLSTWLYRIAVSKALDHLRRKKRKKRFAFVQSLFGLNEEEVRKDPGFKHPGLALENKEKGAIVFAAIDKLPENQKTAFVLHKLEGLSYQEVAAVMETSVPAVESLIHRARQQLRKLLETYYRKNPE
jgi:RNA polymerase sigma factor (sigma-70 family)